MISPEIYRQLLPFRTGPIRCPEGPTPMLRYLTEGKYIQVVENNVFPDLSIKPIAWEITPLGLSALSEYEKAEAEKAEQKAEKEAAEAKRLKERREVRADEERRYRTQNKIAIIMPIVTFLLGLVVEHFSGILGALLDLFS